MGKTIIVRRVVEDLTPSDAEKEAERLAEKRIELLGVVNCHSKKPSKSHRVREIGYGRGKTYHVDVHSSAWKDYCEGRITIGKLKASMFLEEGKAPVSRERPAWLQEIMAQRLAASLASEAKKV